MHSIKDALYWTINTSLCGIVRDPAKNVISQTSRRRKLKHFDDHKKNLMSMRGERKIVQKILYILVELITNYTSK